MPAGRVVFLVRVPLDRADAFLDAYEQVRHDVAAGVPGHVRDQLCRSTTDPEQWLITSEWEHLDAFVAWEASPDHVALVQPLRACFTDARSLRFEVLAETGRAVAPTGAALTAGSGQP